MNKKIVLVILLSVFWGPNTIAQTNGCTDPLALNFNAQASNNDGSCYYEPISINPDKSILLSDTLQETSGLLLWNSYLWTHNDNSDQHIYALNTTTGAIVQQIKLNQILNKDWEEIGQDSNFIYIGDFGNNVEGNRKDLHFLRVAKNSLSGSSQQIDTISFSYPQQNSFMATGSNNTDFDCEAFIVAGDSIYLFTKQWISQETALYAVPKLPGNYNATLKATYNVQGLITGAYYREDKRLVTLCGYNNLLQPFIFLLYDFKGTDFFTGNKRKVNLSLPFHQIEGIASGNGLQYYLTNEAFFRASVNTPQKLHFLNLQPYLESYINPTLGISSANRTEAIAIYPNPAKSCIYVTAPLQMLPGTYTISNASGKPLLQGKLDKKTTAIQLPPFPSGIYYISFSGAIGGRPFLISYL